jgi:hypothetical protein
MTRGKAFVLTVIGSSVVALACYFVGQFIPEEHADKCLFVVIGILWTVFAAIAITRAPLAHLILVGTGLTWGFLITMSILISIQNWRISVSWVPFLVGLIAMPLGSLISVLPFWALGKRTLTPASFISTSAGLILLILMARFGVLPFTYKGKVAPPGDYDAAALEVQYSPNPIKVGDNPTFQYTIKNVGKSTIPAGTYEVEFFINGKKVGFDYATSELKPGIENTYYHPTGSFKASEEGVHTYKLIVDPRNRLKETDKTNNILEGSFQIIK